MQCDDCCQKCGVCNRYVCGNDSSACASCMGQVCFDHLRSCCEAQDDETQCDDCKVKYEHVCVPDTK